jgi:hypothetical protein
MWENCHYYNPEFEKQFKETKKTEIEYDNFKYLATKRIAELEAERDTLAVFKGMEKWLSGDSCREIQVWRHSKGGFACLLLYSDIPLQTGDTVHGAIEKALKAAKESA